MAVTYGFFDSINGDRKYNADQMSNYFEGVIGDGVFKNVDNELQVAAHSGLTVKVKTGRAMVKCRWLRNSTDYYIEITPDSTYSKYVAICVEWDYQNRKVDLVQVSGTAASTPVKPSMTRTADKWQLALAYILVSANATSISQSNISDARSTDDCGWVTGVIEQLSTDTLFAQWESIYQDYLNAMQENFNDFLELLTADLNVSTFIQKYTKTYTKDSEYDLAIPLNMQGYTYNSNDIIEVYINGLHAMKNVDYTEQNAMFGYCIFPNGQAIGSVFDIVVYKSKVGFNALIGSDASPLEGSDDNLLSGT